ncbi:MAG: hypothetical protein ONB46_09785 [candidate division KSB1 bacterium]|nr:hypothetical protein [candidate division KSB1 bacterium]MDZ7366094.1 hypothetical protein [candidate division KSB1 bacterium]MDZ7404264.1 hypothetical protein [candidate division KSB1 bacterium]
MPAKTREMAPLKRTLDELIKRAKALSGLKTKQEILDQARQLFLRHLEQQKILDKQKSFYELTKHLAGSVEGPSDLLAVIKSACEDLGDKADRRWQKNLYILKRVW